MPELRYRFQALNAQEVIRSLASINAEMRAGASLSREYAKSVGSVRGPRAGASAGGSSSARGGVRYEERLAQQVAKAQERAFARSETEKTRTLEREVRRRSQIEERHQRYRDRVKNTSMLRDQRDEERHARARLRQHAQHVREYERNRETGLREQARMGGIFGGIGAAAVIGAGVAVGSAATQVGGAAIRKRLSMEESATRLSVNSRGAGKRAVSAGELMAEASSVAKSVKGAKAEDVLEAMTAYVTETGDLGQARSMAKTFAQTSMASGASMRDVAAAAAGIRSSFGITSEKDMQAALAKMVFQGKSGSFEMGDAAAKFSKMGAAGARFGIDKGVEGVAIVNALAQSAKATVGNGEGSGATAATAVEAMLRQIINKGSDDKSAEGLKALTGGKLNKRTGKYEGGVEVFTDATRTKAKDIRELIPAILAGTGGDIGKLNTMMGDEGMKGFSKFLEVFNQAQGALGPGASSADKKAAGSKAVTEYLANLIKTGGDWSEVQQDADLAGNTTNAKLTTLGETLMTTVGNALAPATATLAKHMGLLTAPIESAGKNLSVLAQAFSDVVDTLVALKLIKKDSGPQETGAIAMAKIAQNDAELADLAKTEATFGLTTEQGYRKSELQSQNVALAQRAAAGTGLEAEYGAYKASIDAANAAPWHKDAQIKTKDFAEFMRGTDQFKAAAMAKDALSPAEGIEGKYGKARDEWANFNTATSILGGPAAGGINAAIDLGARGLDAVNGTGYGGKGSAGEGAAAIIADVMAKAAQQQEAAATALTSAAKQMAVAGTPKDGNP